MTKNPEFKLLVLWILKPSTFVETHKTKDERETSGRTYVIQVCPWTIVYMLHIAELTKSTSI